MHSLNLVKYAYFWRTQTFFAPKTVRSVQLFWHGSRVWRTCYLQSIACIYRHIHSFCLISHLSRASAQHSYPTPRQWYSNSVCPIMSVSLSVCPSVSLSTTRWLCVKTTELIINQSASHGSLETIVFDAKALHEIPSGAPNARRVLK